MNTKSSDDDGAGLIVLARGIGILLVLVLLPGVGAGLGLAELLRRRRLSWSWAAAGLLLSAPALMLCGPGSLAGLRDAGLALLRGKGDLAALPSFLWPFWLGAAFPVAISWKLWRDHRAVITGGSAEIQARDQIGPLQLLLLRRRNRRDLAAGPATAGGVLLGSADRGRAVRIPPLVAHALIVGGSNTGKTNTAEVLLEGHVAGGSGFLILDGKGGRDLPRAAVELGARYQRPVALWSVFAYGVPELDALRLPWNVTGEGNPTEIKDRIASTEEQSEAYFRAVASRGLLMASRGLTATYGRVSLDQLASCLENKDRLAAVLKAAGEEEFAADLRWLGTLGDTEKSGMRGMGLRLQTMCQSDGGEWLLPAAAGEGEISLHRAITEGWLVVFSLPQGLYPELIPHTARYVMSTLNGVCTRLETEGVKADFVCFVDELSAFDGEQFSSSYERARSAGVSICVATQSVSNLESAGGEKLLDAALDNSELIVVHRQAVPKAAELLASVGGTEEAWEHTQQVQDGRGFGSGIGIELGLDESGQRARRLTDRFRVHPNVIKSLRIGEAVVMTTRPQMDVRVVQIRRGLSAKQSLPRTPAARARWP